MPVSPVNASFLKMMLWKRMGSTTVAKPALMVIPMEKDAVIKAVAAHRAVKSKHWCQLKPKCSRSLSWAIQTKSPGAD